MVSKRNTTTQQDEELLDLAHSVGHLIQSSSPLVSTINANTIGSSRSQIEPLTLPALPFGRGWAYPERTE